MENESVRREERYTVNVGKRVRQEQVEIDQLSWSKIWTNSDRQVDLNRLKQIERKITEKKEKNKIRKVRKIMERRDKSKDNKE